MKKKISTEDRRQVLKKGASILGVSVCGKGLSALMAGCESDTLKSSGKTVEFSVSPTIQTIEFDVSSRLNHHTICPKFLTILNIFNFLIIFIIHDVRFLLNVYTVLYIQYCTCRL